MKTIIFIVALVLLCETANAVTIDEDQHYIIAAIVWDNETGEFEADVPVTFMYHPYFADECFTLKTAEDGSVVFDVANMPRGVRNNSVIMVSCKYGIKNAPVIYGNWGTGITFNEPDEITAIEAFAAMGFVAIAIGGGRYLLRRGKSTDHKGDTMTEENNETTDTTDTRSKLKQDFGVRALIATMAMLGYVGASGIAAYRGDMDMLKAISSIYMPIIGAIIIFYYNGSSIRDASK